jgi:peroxiredoxin
VELPRLEPLWRDLGDHGFVVLAIEVTQNRDQALQFIRSNGLTYRFVEDRSGADAVAEQLYGVMAYPTSMLLDRDGRIRYHHVGFRPGYEDFIKTEALQLLAE